MKRIPHNLSQRLITLGQMTLDASRVRSVGGDYRVLVSLIAVLALVLRIFTRLSLGGTRYFHGYQFYWILARNYLDGKGLCAHATDLGWSVIGGNSVDILGWVCAYITPGYPLFLAFTLKGGTHHLWWMIPQILLSTGTVIFAYWIGKHLFDSFTGLLSSLLVAVYPYYVWHDSALQDTCVHNFLIVLAVYLLLLTKRSDSLMLPALTGLILGMGILVKSTLVPFSILALGWILVLGAETLRARLRKAVLACAMLTLAISPWIARNWVILGAPVLSSQGGLYFWQANHHETSFLCFPEQDMDCSLPEAWASLSENEIAELQGLSGDEVAQGDWFMHKGLEYIKSHPARTVENAIRKILIAFSWKFYPETTLIVQVVYSLFYVPILILGIIGMIRSRQGWREQSIIYALFLAFLGIVAMFKGYVSYRSHLDLFLMVYCAYAVRTFLSYCKKTMALRRLHSREMI